jgi:hypothetical protein
MAPHFRCFLLARGGLPLPSWHMALTRPRLQTTSACVGTFLIWWWRGGTVPAALALVAGGLALLAWVAPAHYAPVQRTLDRALHLGLVALTWALLGVVYFLVFTPLRFFRDRLGRDPLARRRDPAVATYLQPLPPGPPRFDRQF